MRGGTRRLVRLAADGIAILALLAALVFRAVTHPLILTLSAVAATATAGWWVYGRQRRRTWERHRQHGLRYALPRLDALHHRDFDHAVGDLMRRDGCTDVRHIGGAESDRADILATDPTGRIWVVQCKHRAAGERSPAVDVPDLRRLAEGSRRLYGADVVLIVTNGRFTGRCAPPATEPDIHLTDRRILSAWAGGGRPLWELLPDIAGASRSGGDVIRLHSRRVVPEQVID